MTVKNVKFLLLLLLGVFLSSCTHWIVDTETRIQMINNTDKEIHGLSIISSKEKSIVLVPDTLKNGEVSDVYENSWVGKFKFAIFVVNSSEIVDLGEHELKGGSVRAHITGKGMVLK